MKTFLLLCGLTLTAAPASAQKTISVQAVKNVVPNSISCSSITVYDTAVELTGNTVAPSSLPLSSVPTYELKIMTLSASATSYFSDSASVASSGNNIGVPVYPFLRSELSGQQQPLFVSFEINPYQLFYAIGPSTGVSFMRCRKR